MKKETLKHDLPWYVKVYVEGRKSENEPWGLRNMLRDDNAAVLDPIKKFTHNQLLEKANAIAEDWRRGHLEGGQVRVVDLTKTA